MIPLKEKCFIGLGHKIHNMSLEHLVVPEIKDLPKTDTSMGTQEPKERALDGQSSNDFSDKVK